MDLATYFDESFTHHGRVVEKTRAACREAFFAMVDVCANALKNGNKLLFFGNGGSAADAQHLAAEFSVRLVGDRDPLRALALSTDAASLTACGNDYGFQEIFARQVHALGRAGDVAIGLSTSGKSKNVVLALQKALHMGLTPVGFAGRSGGDMVGLAAPLILVPAEETMRIQEMHMLLGHMLCAAIEHRLGVG